MKLFEYLHEVGLLSTIHFLFTRKGLDYLSTGVIVHKQTNSIMALCQRSRRCIQAWSEERNV